MTSVVPDRPNPKGAQTAAEVQEAKSHLALKKVLGPAHIWGLGVGIVLVGEYMGWNFSVQKGGMFGALIAAWVAFAGAGVMFLLSALGLWHSRRVSPEAEVLPKLGAHAPAPVEQV